MITLIYGSGNCSIEGSGVRGVQIYYSGKVRIKDKTPDNFYIGSSNNKIIKFPLGEGTLDNLFDYEGELNIRKVIVANNQGEKIECFIKRAMDYSELLGDSDTITANSEDLKQEHISGRKVSKTSVDRNIIANKHTSELGTLYLKDGSEYSGNIHIHINGGAIMTGGEHGKDSKVLYFKKKDKLISTDGYKPRQRKRKVRIRY
mgnify:CR=1 FL=1